MQLKCKKIFVILFFAALYLFSELVLPINYAFSHILYDDDIEYEYCDESYQNYQTDHTRAYSDEEDENEEIDNDCFLGVLNDSEKPCRIAQISKLNLENILNVTCKPYKIVQFGDNLYKQNIVDTSTGVRNTLANLRTVILLN